MKKTTVRLDDQIHAGLVQIAKDRGLSLNHLINYALVRFVSFEEAFQMMEERVHRAKSGAIRTVLQKTVSHHLPPDNAEDELPTDFSRRVLLARLKREADLQQQG